MVAIGRAMMSAPKILMLDEPSLGLSPLLCKELFQNLATVKELGIGVLLIEQNAKQSLAIADRGYLLENTRITHEDSATNLARDPAVQKADLGAGSATTSAPPPSTTETAPPPPPKPIAPRSQPRISPDQHPGINIDDLVQDAAATSLRPRASASHVDPSAIDRAAAPGIKTVLQEIEDAAKAARNRARPRSTEPRKVPYENPTLFRCRKYVEF